MSESKITVLRSSVKKIICIKSIMLVLSGVKGSYWKT